jgi:hypothetical protein
MTISREILAVFQPAPSASDHQSWILIAESRPPQESSRRRELNAHGYGATLDWYSMIGSFFVPHTTCSRMLLKGAEGGAKFGGTKMNALKLLWLQLGRHETEALARK